ncbi:amidohydrolase family protein [Pedobacter mucosus]|uniref:amidohydrolase family protein n=1 Tax=Pedobacter mucosus TaxID=2895286 RepID=UPI001EE4C842|nr:amidohydrolase family protein [Pedobacter mucosus]UKT63219.1 amidohydrolase family protein [Pedobacter mucosus]
MHNFISADWIFPITSNPIKDGVIELNLQGDIVQVLSKTEALNLKVNIVKYNGAIVPGFINTHCHLELSHMLGQIPEKTGLVEFVQSVIKNRNADAEQISRAMEDADTQMQKNGIVAVGDIANQVISKEVKLKSKLHYYTFVEAMGFNPERADAIMDYAKEIATAFNPLISSVVPHAPYSVSPALLQLINENAKKENAIISIHNQETKSENLFFKDKTGSFLDLYKFLQLDISFFQPTGKTSIQSWLPFVNNQKILLVHNTEISKADIDFAKQTNNDLYWCLCPQANLYIENTLPDVDLLIDEGLKITLGTDSLASNHQLNILSEMKTLQQYKKVDFEKLLKWATLNGAEFLSLDDKFGSIEVGKRPGLNLIQLSDDFIIGSDQVEKIN